MAATKDSIIENLFIQILKKSGTLKLMSFEQYEQALKLFAAEIDNKPNTIETIQQGLKDSSKPIISTIKVTLDNDFKSRELLNELIRISTKNNSFTCDLDGDILNLQISNKEGYLVTTLQLHYYII